jgi:hypothetical protein
MNYQVRLEVLRNSLMELAAVHQAFACNNHSCSRPTSAHIAIELRYCWLRTQLLSFADVATHKSESASYMNIVKGMTAKARTRLAMNTACQSWYMGKV